MLRAFVLARDDDAGREMREAHRGVGDVDVLAAGAARPVGVDAQVVLVDLDIDVLGQLGPDVHGRERGVSPRRLIERRDAHQPVHARFGREQPVGVVAGHGERRALQPGFVARLIVDHLALEAAALGPPQIHAQQHLRPVLRLGAAGARMDGDDRVLAIVLAAEHLLDLAGLDFLVERVERLARTRRRPARRLQPIRPARQIVAPSSGATRISSSSCSSRRRRCSTFWASA